VVKLQVKVWVVKQHSVVVICECFGGSVCLHLHGEVDTSVLGDLPASATGKDVLVYGGSKVLQNVGVLSWYYASSQPRKPQLEFEDLPFSECSTVKSNLWSQCTYISL